MSRRNEKPQKDATNDLQFGLTLLGCPLLLTCHIAFYSLLVNAVVVFINLSCKIFFRVQTLRRYEDIDCQPGFKYPVKTM